MKKTKFAANLQVGDRIAFRSSDFTDFNRSSERNVPMEDTITSLIRTTRYVLNVGLASDRWIRLNVNQTVLLAEDDRTLYAPEGRSQSQKVNGKSIE